MPPHDSYMDFEDFEGYEQIPYIRNMPRTEQRKAPVKPPKAGKSLPAADPVTQLIDSEDNESKFDFSYHASRHERQWILDSLGPFYEGQWLDDVLRLVKGGKEAHVYQCQANPSVVRLTSPYLAAKVYRPRMFRNLRKDHIYREGRHVLDGEGRLVRDDRSLHAIEKRTAYGRQVMHTSWIEHEFQTMTVLFAAGADVPVPLARGNNAILMAFIGGDTFPAPTLNTIDLDSQDVQPLFARVLHNIDLMLANGIVHGDLSAYNILYWERKIHLIDFPQAIDPAINRNAFSIFARDVRRICEYFAGQGVDSNPKRLAVDLWTKHGYRLMPEVHPELLDGDDEDDRAYWRDLDQH